MSSFGGTKLWGRAIVWWLQLKPTRVWKGKEKINAWEKLLKHIRAAFLPLHEDHVSTIAKPLGKEQDPWMIIRLSSTNC